MTGASAKDVAATMPTTVAESRISGYLRTLARQTRCQLDRVDSGDKSRPSPGFACEMCVDVTGGLRGWRLRPTTEMPAPNTDSSLRACRSRCAILCVPPIARRLGTPRCACSS
jgi:hypothetical protein